MSRARSCHCLRPSADVIRDGKGAQIAIACKRCMRFISQRCRVCLRDYRDVPLHLAKTECGPFDEAGMWWTADRPPWAGSPPEESPAT